MDIECGSQEELIDVRHFNKNEANHPAEHDDETHAGNKSSLMATTTVYLTHISNPTKKRVARQKTENQTVLAALKKIEKIIGDQEGTQKWNSKGGNKSCQLDIKGNI